jgi:selenocysteine-specific elongation factor
VEVSRRGAVRRTHLARLGIPLETAARFPGAADWLVDPQQWQRWLEQIPGELAVWAQRNPLEPAVPVTAIRRSLGVPDDALVMALAAAAGLRVADGRVAGQQVRPGLAAAEPALQTVLDRLRSAPFAAPERDELVALRLGRRELAAAERAGHIVRLADDIVVRPDALELAAQRLADLPQPFTTSEARQALSSTRRVVIPLLERLDRAGVTERVDAMHRRLRNRGAGRAL